MDTATRPLTTNDDRADQLAPFTTPARFAGPHGIANGGWLSGQLASHLVPEDAGFPHRPVEVTLRAPTPVDHELVVERRADGVRLLDGEQLLAEARLGDSCPLPPAPVDRARAALAEAAYAGWWDHPFVDCFVCGLRQPDEGLRLFTGPVDGRPGVVASRWTVPTVLSGGVTPTHLLWAALDCPTGWAHHRPGGVALLGRLTGQIHRPVVPGEQLVVVARADGRQGRRLHSRCAIYDRASRVVAASQAVWLTPDS
jgi:hypothetical protein